MSLSINWNTRVITVPKAYLTEISDPEYEMDVDQFRLDLRDLEDDEEGIVFLPTHEHNTEVSVGGVTLARVVILINNYTITFEDGQYVVSLTGANNNIMDVVNHNQVSIRSSNSAGLIVVTQGSGVTEQDKEDIANLVWEVLTNLHETVGTYGFEILEAIKQNKESNVSYTFVEATEQIIARNVAVGVINYITIKVKKDADSNWDSPISTENLYYWYENLGDTNPIYVGEET